MCKFYKEIYIIYFKHNSLGVRTDHRLEKKKKKFLSLHEHNWPWNNTTDTSACTAPTVWLPQMMQCPLYITTALYIHCSWKLGLQKTQTRLWSQKHCQWSHSMNKSTIYEGTGVRKWEERGLTIRSSFSWFKWAKNYQLQRSLIHICYTDSYSPGSNWTTHPCFHHDMAKNLVDSQTFSYFPCILRAPHFCSVSKHKGILLLL